MPYPVTFGWTWCVCERGAKTPVPRALQIERALDDNLRQLLLELINRIDDGHIQKFS